MPAPPAEVRTDPDGSTTLVWRREYPDPVEHVWAAITDSDRLGRWIGTWTGEPTLGSVRFTMTGEVDAGGEVDAPVDVLVHVCDPPHRLVVDLPDPGGAEAWHLELTVDPHGDGTVLVFAQRLVGGVRREDVEAGWSWYLDRLEASLQRRPMPAWDDYVA